MTRRRLILIAPAALAACSVLPDRPYIPTERFPLEPRRTGAPVARLGRRTLLLRTLGAGAGLDSRNLRVLRPDGTVQVDFYAEWAALPAEGAEQALRRWLIDSRLFSAILAPGSRLNPDFIMEGELTTLIADQGQGIARAELTLLLIDERNGSRLVGQLVSEGTAPLPGGTAPPTAEQAASAMTAALGNAFASLERALTRYG
ncbi:membrane integrity-associated transporter subunit PqiC [Roseomonas sp. HJA6]|uniref:Membrane integrity-associated transporter subunit PqiC n=1 Tax=Roseomonas alba TaxID=2846776 RepID=A0ABS7ADY1_9PROT|nr:ABC-type transport auxiliary lipoprotein family protein [Neoroseomonas alba]MBW6400510.1 membrane integrity-associated transporter subunit PqiC [Neoroseomonas alba]